MQAKYEILPDSVRGDSFNGVTLFDATGRPEREIRYEWDPVTQEFTALLSDQQDFSA